MRNQTFCSSPAALHLLQICLDLPSMSYIGEVGGTTWRQIDSTAGAPKSLVIFRKTF